ncbi:acyl-CoA dehydrogenase family protein [Kibdelosporangium persicum]|uniref:Dibenzothiophene desulfurization enzyme C n=1 Tax=Kibdelosporangium persicum TaxID=2698649 RepID=A0ABX2F790_9PSEU|nr:acyl-CoA dehydrogenase family protein [Kibdelosporangium persicum]NRN67053.1 Dibenzothiophene desulfurization enzyme C [Kibdelosporangium persicum]
MTTTEQPPVRGDSGSPPEWALAPLPTTPEGWDERSRQVGRLLLADGAARDRAAKTPYDEIQLLKDAGLVNILAPAHTGGGGMEWPTAYRVVRGVASGDGSIGQLIGDHFLWAWLPRIMGTPEQVVPFEAAGGANRYFYGCALNPRFRDIVVRDEGDHLVFNGRKTFCTGVKVSDYSVIEGLLEGTEDTYILAYVPIDQPGVVFHDDWDNMGQRLTESGSVTFNDIKVPWSDALGWRDKKHYPRVYNTMNVPTGQLMFANIYAGVARGALITAEEYTRTQGTAWGGYERTVDEPRVLDVIGDLTTKLWTLEAFLDQVAEDGLEIHRDPDALTERKRGEYKVRTGAARARSAETALEITARIFEVTGARSTASKYGYDRFWRNVRTHSLHHPIYYHRQEVGKYQLLDQIPKPGRYS